MFSNKTRIIIAVSCLSVLLLIALGALAYLQDFNVFATSSYIASSGSSNQAPVPDSHVPDAHVVKAASVAFATLPTRFKVAYGVLIGAVVLLLAGLGVGIYLWFNQETSVVQVLGEDEETVRARVE